MDYFDALRLICRPIRSTEYPHTLEPMQALLKALGNPEQSVPAVVVAGSVGKGTVCHQIAEALRQATLQHDKSHLRVGLYTSPHLHSFRERFVIDGQMISQQSFVKALTEVQAVAFTTGEHFSTFELATAVALWWFREQGVEIAVMEVGIGGRWDAVNGVPNILAVITSIELEHVVMLGGSLRSIAEHKAGIIKRGGWVVTAEQVPDVMNVLHHEADGMQAAIQVVADDQVASASVHNLVEREIIANVTRTANLAPVYLPGRLEFVQAGNKQVLVDGAHTLRSATRLRRAIDHEWGVEPVIAVIGMLRDKAAAEVLGLFDDERFQILLTQAGSHRAFTADELEATASLRRAQVSAELDLNKAFQFAVDSDVQRIVITGSLRMAATAREYLGLLSERELIESHATRLIFEGESYLSHLKRG